MNLKQKIGAIIIGNEILSGRRDDAHFPFLLDLCKRYDFSLSWVHYLPDDIEMLVSIFKKGFLSADTTIFSFGGIGITPDDLTKKAIALANDSDLIEDPLAYEELKLRFDNDLSEKQKLHALLPEGAECILNPFNRIGAFKVHNIYCLPGFPQMSHKIIEQEIHTNLQKFKSNAVYQEIFKIFNAKESELVDMMIFIENHFSIVISSLPILETPAHIELGLHGDQAEVEKAYEYLRVELEPTNIRIEKY